MEGFIKASDAVSKLLKYLNIDYENQYAYTFWEEIIGKKLAEKISIVGIKHKTIIVQTVSSAYRHHVKLYQKEWLKKINDIIGKNKFEKIIFI